MIAAMRAVAILVGVTTLTTTVSAQSPPVAPTPAAPTPAPPAGPRPATLAPDVQQCVDDHAAAQRHRNQGKLVDASRRMLACAQSHCPGIARQDCGQWLDAIESQIPTVVFEFIDEKGEVRSDVKVSAAGHVVSPRLDGKAVSLDPGVYAFRFERHGMEAVVQNYTVLEAHQGQLVRVSLFDGPADRPTTTSGHNFAGPIVLGGLALVSWAGFAGFAVASLREEDDLRESCAPTCDEATGALDALDDRRLAADVFLATAMVTSAATGLLLVLTWPEQEPTVSLRPRGAGATLRVSF